MISKQCESCGSMVSPVDGLFAVGPVDEQALFRCFACHDTMSVFRQFVRVLVAVAPIVLIAEQARAEERERCARVCVGLADMWLADVKDVRYGDGAL